MFAVVVIALPIPSAEPRDSVTHPFIRLVDENSLSFVHSFVILSLGKGPRAICKKIAPYLCLSLERTKPYVIIGRERKKKKQRLSVAFVCLPKNRALVIEKIAEVKASSSAGGAWGEGTEENLSAGKSRAFLFPSFFSSSDGIQRIRTRAFHFQRVALPFRTRQRSYTQRRHTHTQTTTWGVEQQTGRQGE